MRLLETTAARSEKRRNREEAKRSFRAPGSLGASLRPPAVVRRGLRKCGEVALGGLAGEFTKELTDVRCRIVVVW